VTRLARKLARFCVVGGLCVALNVLVFWLLIDIAGLNYLIVTAIAFFVVGGVGYLLNRVWTFESHEGAIAQEASRFYTVQALTLAASLVCMRILVGSLGMNVLLACVVQSAMFMVANFTAHLGWTFREKT